MSDFYLDPCRWCGTHHDESGKCSQVKALPELVVTRDGVPCPDQKAAIQEFKDRCLASSKVSALTLALADATAEMQDEVLAAMNNWPPFNSAHEGYGVLLEEVDELKAHVWTKQKNRDLPAMRKEAIQVAAMAIRFAIEICNEERGRK